MPSIANNPNLPVGTQAETLQAIEYASTHDTTEAEETQLRKFAQHWGVSSQFLTKVYAKRNASMEEQRDMDSEFALVVKKAGEVIEARFPLALPECSAYALIAEARQLPHEMRKSAACRLSKAGAQHPLLPCLTGSAEIDREGLRKAAEDRSYLYRDAANIAAMKELTKTAGECDVAKAVAGMDLLDRAEGLHKTYGGAIDLPELSAYRPAVKRASVEISLANGCRVSVDKLQKLSSESLRALDDDLSAALDDGKGRIDLVKAASALPRIPADYANMLMTLLG